MVQTTLFDIVATIQDTKTKKPFHKFNFREIEDNINFTYRKIREAEIVNDIDEYNTGLAEIYKLIADMMFAVLSVDPPEYFVKNGVDTYEEACSFALIVLDRIKNKRINWDYTIRHAWTWYVKISSKFFHYSYPQIKGIETSLERLIEEMDPVLQDASTDESPFLHVQVQDRDHILYEELFQKLLFVMQLYYEKSELSRLFPLVLFSIQFPNTKIPMHVARLKGLFLVVLKRLFSSYAKEDKVELMKLDKSVDKNIVTLILLMFLSGQENETVPIELTSSLDFFSIFRLSIFAGGKTLYIPTVDELEGVVTAASALSTMLLEGTDSKSSRQLAKHDIGYNYDIRRLNQFIKIMVNNLSSSDNILIKDLCTDYKETFFLDLVNNLKHVSNCQLKLIDDLDNKIGGSHPEELINYLSELDSSERKMVTFIERLIQLKSDPVVGLSL